MSAELRNVSDLRAQAKRYRLLAEEHESAEQLMIAAKLRESASDIEARADEVERLFKARAAK
jgi:hypothetical protein